MISICDEFTCLPRRLVGFESSLVLFAERPSSTSEIFVQMVPLALPVDAANPVPPSFSTTLHPISILVNSSVALTVSDVALGVDATVVLVVLPADATTDPAPLSMTVNGRADSTFELEDVDLDGEVPSAFMLTFAVTGGAVHPLYTINRQVGGATLRRMGDIAWLFGDDVSRTSAVACCIT